ncbi:hypothetical protein METBISCDRAFT_24294 [Metschnikowia bicuspidata]|uniref:Uncharacterized protein n=1 Tax=Metschnikowia bicuspidata TaxID=27322 RepID=A0A4P9Z9F2_9ASCO|nr:hypothetical protein METBISCDRAFT_24294 [Metschnikowia bicuspidata]
MTRVLSFILLLASFGLTLGATSSETLTVTSRVIALITISEYIFTTNGHLTTVSITGGTLFIPVTTTGLSASTITSTFSFPPATSSSVTSITTPKSSSLSSPTASGSRNSAGRLSAPITTSSTSPTQTSFSVPPGLYLTSYSRTTITTNTSPVVVDYKILLTNTC